VRRTAGTRVNFAHILKEIGAGGDGPRDLPAAEAQQLYAAMLDGGVPDLELGAILLALRIKGESLPELLGFHQALTERLYRLRPPGGGVRTVVIPTYDGAQSRPNLLPLVALLLQRMNVPVLLHGTLEGHGRVASAYILRELGILPSGTLAQAQEAFDREKLAFVPTAVLSPGLANLLSLRSRLGVRSSAHLLARLIDPFGGASLRLASVSHPAYLEKLRQFFLATGDAAIVMQGTEGEAYANPQKRPRIELCRDGEAQLLFEEEHAATPPPEAQDLEAKATAAWIRKALEGGAALPLPMVNQLACILYGAGYTTDFNQAKAIVAVETRSLAAA
jgi:anthranilate phosphoribosyltransferase